MGKILRFALCASLVAAGMATPAMAGDPSGNYKRKNGDLVRVWVTDGKLYCRIMEGSKPNFEMCHGMTESGEAWTGKKMKHPGMPGFMTFNGTVTNDATSLKIKGCAMGKSMCDSEVWQKIVK
ncbi:MAG: hypothetical protein IE933_03115 [Sphingomonadales bacterium]|nr:hypothetical protein [Sphingomonadales bacterium]MBD3774214.1 hypothetical protein [Paracoccaceae bacterium]